MRPYVEALVEAPTDHNRARAARLGPLDARTRAAITDVRDAYLLKPRFDTFRQRAAVFHTDAAILGDLPLIVDPPKQAASRGVDRSHPQQRVDVRSTDGRVENFALANPNWDYARDMLDAVSLQRRSAIVAPWYRAIGAYFAAHDNLADALRHFEQAHGIVPDDPGVLFGEACFQETLGAPAVQNFARVTVLPNGFTLLGVTTPQTHFRRAETLLTRALSAQPDFVDARLRLGRVLATQGRQNDALPHFARVIAETRDPVLTYYAHLFAGDAALALDRASDARASYERALAAHPNAQAARIGLAAALRASGNRGAAVDAVMVTLTIPPQTRDSDDDPWWEYYKGDAANVERLLHELRAPFSDPAK
jgi:tetratricopeptide (TPR) repeat protein